MTEVQRPYISVVIPALNEELFLRATLDSLARQTYRDFEIIVVDNGSTDQTAAIARAAGARVVNCSQRGVCAARQAGTLVARGQIIVSTDADTKFPADWLAKYAAAFSDPDVVLATGRPIWSEAPAWHRIYTWVLFGFIRAWQHLTGRLCYASAGNLAFRKRDWQGYNSKLTQGGDEFFVVKQLRPYGAMKYLPNNPVMTSSRRIKRGLLYTLIMTLLVYYVGDYALSRLTKRSVLSLPEIRDRRSQRPGLGWRMASFTLIATIAFSLIYTKVPMAHALSKDVHHHLHRPDVDLKLRRDWH